MNLTHDQIRAWRPCWDAEVLAAVLKRHKIWTPELIAAQADITYRDRVWALLRCCSQKQQRLLAANWAERLLLRERESRVVSPTSAAGTR